MKVEFDDECPQCGELCTHAEDDDSYSIKCHTCKFSGSWKSLDEFMVWYDSQRAKKIRNETRKAKKEAKRLNFYEE